jgi:hypothetical protein
MLVRSILVTLIFAVAVCLNIVGRWDERPSGMTIRHGWPFVFMQRAGTYVPSTASPFTDDIDAVLAHRLPIDSAIVLEFSSVKLAANVGVVLFGTILIVCKFTRGSSDTIHN